LPAKLTQRAQLPPVPLNVVIKLLLPKRFPSFRRVSKWAIVVSVPEAAVHKNYRFQSWQDNVRTAGQAAYVNAETEAKLM
jgi:hypothetical protein